MPAYNERFSFKSGCAMQVVKLIKEDCYSKNFGIKQKVLSLKYTGVISRRNKFICVAMCSLMMSLCSRDLLVMSLSIITIH